MSFGFCDSIESFILFLYNNRKYIDIYYIHFNFRHGKDTVDPNSNIMKLVQDFSLQERITSWVFYSKVLILTVIKRKRV